MEKRLPYQESEEYLIELIDKKTENAIMLHRKAKSRKRWSMMTASAAAVALLLIGFGVKLMFEKDKQPIVTLSGDGPLDEFLNLRGGHAHHLLHGLGVGDVVAGDHRVLDMLVEVVEFHVRH